jgi:DNA polymerase III delta prime subunit
MKKETVFDKEALRENFEKLADSGKLSHAYLFFGESGNGEKEKFAKSLANFLENGDFSFPERGLEETLIVSPNEKGSIGIDAIRDVKRFLWQKASSEAGKRTAIVENAESLTFEAQNSALKIVEEPPANCLIVFTANNENNLLPALRSRLQKIHFPDSVSGKNGKLAGDILDGDISDAEINIFFKEMIGRLAEDPVKNSKKLKLALKRLSAIKQFNVNKRLQLKTLLWTKN